MQGSLYQLILSRPLERLAIVGMTKNVGKTVTLNYLVEHFSRGGEKIGLVSAGYDGERFDRLTLKDKPRIFAPAGTVIATAEACAKAAEARLELLFRSELFTPLGEVLVCRAREPGLVELVGPGSRRGLKLVVDKMKDYGAGRILVDGAINRLASASPLVSQGVVLATGAAVSPVMEDTVRKTLFRCTLLETPAVEEEALRAAAGPAAERGETALIHGDPAGYQVEPLPAPTPLLAAGGIRERCRKNTAAIFLGGALVDGMVEELIDRELYPVLILQEATRIFLSPELYQRYTGRGGAIRVMEEIKLIAVTVNPTDPLGKGFPPRDFYRRMAEALAPRPVYDLVWQEGARP